MIKITPTEPIRLMLDVSMPWKDRTARALAPLDRLFDRVYGSPYNPLYQTGALAVGLLLVMLATGLYLLWFYKTGQPFESVTAIHEQVWAGRWIRSLHRYSADLAMLAVGLHMLRMFLQGKTWGPRALAWITGLILLGIMLLCGWTGLVLVWDRHGQVVAMEGAKLLDLLPIFSEPISRAFVRAGQPPSAFFFLNLFAHIALPLGLGLFIWVHTMRVARATLLPPRALWRGTVAALLAMAVLVPVPMGEKADLLALPDHYLLDVFYSFWVPVSQAVPAWVHLALWGALFAVLGSLPWWWRPRPETVQEPSFLDEQMCTGCTQCSLDCPYEAIAMVSRTEGTGSELVARVNPDRCVSCGICAGSCAPMEIGPPMRNGKGQLRDIQMFHTRAKARAGDLFVISCQNGVARHPALAALPDVHVHTAHCAGGVHTSVVEYLMRRGAGGVYLLACPDRDCVYREGPKWLRQRLYEGREAELKERVDARRVRLGNFPYARALAAARDVLAFKDEVHALEHTPRDEGHLRLDEECEPKPLSTSA